MPTSTGKHIALHSLESSWAKITLMSKSVTELLFPTLWQLISTKHQHYVHENSSFSPVCAPFHQVRNADIGDEQQAVIAVIKG